MTKLCVFGAGAIGGFMAAKVAKAEKADVSVVARGPHLEAMKANGLRLNMNGETITTHPRASDSAAELGPQDYVIVTLKAHSISGAVDAIKPLLGPETAIVFGVNGIPWWYFHKLEGAHENKRLRSVDPSGRIWDEFGPERAIGCVVYPATEVVEPGVIDHIEGDRFTLGEPSGEKTERIARLSEILIGSGLKAPVRPKIRDEIWIKLWGNCSFNPLSVLTHATLEQMCQDPQVRAIARAIMVEAQAVGEALGVRFPIDVDKRIAGAEAVGAHKTSMLQDLERGRPMEIDALVTAVAELGQMVDVPTPTLDMILALVQQRARIAGIY